MKISYNWLKQFITIDWKSEQTANLLTDLGLEVEVVETFETIKGGLAGIVVGHVLTCEQHPNADRLKVTTVNVGTEKPLQIVCGASNVAAGQKVAVATIGTILYDKDDKPFQIKKGKIRDLESHGMICAEDEIGLGTSHDGIMVLDENSIIGKPLAEVFAIETDEVFEIGLTPNRADAMSHYGVARDLKAAMLQRGIKTELKTPSVNNFKVEKRILKIDVVVENEKLVPRYCGVTLSGLTVKPSPEWLQNRLKSIGISPKNSLVDATNYVLHELGQPLHAFDASKIKGKINVRNARLNEKFLTLDDVERILHPDDLMICDDEKPMCFAGVFGGKNSGVSETTTSIFLESAYFDPVTVRKMAKRHGLNTDASFRFERGIDINFTEFALKRAAVLIQEIAGGDITSDIIDFYPKKIADFSVFLNFEKVDKIIGEKIPKDTIKKILASLDIKVNSETENGIGLLVPSYRVDVNREIDVVEEILRVYGYNNIKFSEKLNATVFNAPKNEDYKIQNIVASLLTSNGFNEMMANSLTTDSYTTFSENYKEKNNVRILNPLSKDLSVLRQTMLFSGLEALSYNINRKNADLKLFEFGKTYHKILLGTEENKHLTLFASGKSSTENWNLAQKSIGFFEFKSFVVTILERLGISKTKNIATTLDFFTEGLSLHVGSSTLVEFGTIKKSVLKNFDIKQEVFYADFNWATILKLISTKIKISEIAKFPEVTRDLALLIDDQINFDQIASLAKTTEKILLKNIDLFDVYIGKNLPEGKKSYAVRFTLLDDTKTLNDVAIDDVMSRLQHSFEKELGATLR
jgi:phenylalanyl-tRNA synthetase beta chain